MMMYDFAFETFSFETFAKFGIGISQKRCLLSLQNFVIQGNVSKINQLRNTFL